MANLFTGQTPILADNNDGAPGITTATTVRFAQSGTVTGIRFYATTTVGGAYTVQLYRVDAADAMAAGTLLASKTLGVAPTGGTWNSVAFDSPISVSTGVLYRACLFSGAGRYVATTNFFGSDLVNGDITADANGDDPVLLGSLRQGAFLINAAAGYPSGAGNGTCYFVDVEFAAAAGGTSVTPNSLTLTATLGQPTVTTRATATPSSATLSVRLGAPSVTTPAPEPGTSTSSGWNGLLAVRRAADADHRVNREREMNPVECPYDGWPLTHDARGYHCLFGGHMVMPGRY